MKSFNARQWYALPLLLSVSSLSSMAQETRGSIVGRVIDPSGAVIAGVEVGATNIGTNVSISAKSNAEGAYAIPFLLPGTYRLAASAPGFRNFVQKNITLRIADRLQIEIRMLVGAATETVTVTAGVSELESGSATLGQVVDGPRVAQMPVAHGQPYALMGMSPGLSYTMDPRYDRPYEGNFLTGFTMDGVRAGRSTVTLDGSPNTAVMHKWAKGNIFAGYTPPSDIIQELKVQTLSADASVGHTQGGVTSLTLKSGGNQFHGTAYWSGQDPSLNANLFFANKAGDPAGDFTYNRYGASITGPFLIPKIYDGRNRTFLMYAYEGIREARPRGNIFTVPTEAERGGDFSALLKLGSQYQVYDPSTRAPAANGRYTVNPLPNNIVPKNRINPIATNLLKYWAMPNVPGLADGTQNLNRTNYAEDVDYYNHIFRLDQNFSSRHRAFVRGNTFERSSVNANWFNSPATGMHENWLQRALSFDDVYELTPTNILNVRVNFYRQTISRLPPPESIGFDLASLGFPRSYTSLVPGSVRGFPTVTIAQYTGTNAAWFTAPNQNLGLDASLTTVRGKHMIKLGGDIRILRNFMYDYNGTESTGRFEFATTWTKGPFDNSPQSPKGQGLASLLLGLPTGGLINRAASFAEQSTVYSGFVQDDWRITPRLTLNLGLRYELESALTERYNRSVSGFDFQTPNPLNDKVRANYALNPIPEIPASQFQLIGGLRFPGFGGTARALWNRPLDLLMPRLGFAYQLSASTVLRASFGVFYGPLGVERGDVNQSGFSPTTPLVPSLDNGLTFAATLSNPFPNGVQEPRGAADGLLTYAGRDIAFYNADPRPPRQQRWHIGVQRRLPRNVVLEVSYVGNHGSNLETTKSYRSLPLQYLSRLPVRDDATINYLSQQVPNPFYPLLPDTGLSGKNVARSYLLASGNYPQFTAMTSEDFSGYSWYHSLQSKVERRFAKGYTLTAAFTWSKNMEALSHLNGDFSPLEYVISDQDRPFRFAGTGIWELPLGAGKRWLAKSPGFVNAAVRGWQLQGVYTAQSGAALNWGNVFFFGGIKDLLLPSDQRSAERWFNVDAGFERRSALQPSYNYRVFPSRLSGIRGAGTNNVNLSAIKRNTLKEGLKLELRFEAINAFNHTQFDLPNTIPSNVAFGSVTQQLGYARRIQFGAKVIF
jgi:hypothetical protein